MLTEQSRNNSIISITTSTQKKLSEDLKKAKITLAEKEAAERELKDKVQIAVEKKTTIDKLESELSIKKKQTRSPRKVVDTSEEVKKEE